MKRILVIGNAGAGKTTFSKRLATALNLPLIHLDHLYWLPGWVKRDRDEFRALLQKELEKDAWVIDGNYSSTMLMRAEYADTIISFEFPRMQCLYGVLKRNYIDRTDQAPDCKANITLPFIKWIIFDCPRDHREAINTIKAALPDKKVIVFKTRKQTDDFLQQLPARQAA